MTSSECVVVASPLRNYRPIRVHEQNCELIRASRGKTGPNRLDWWCTEFLGGHINDDDDDDEDDEACFKNNTSQNDATAA